MPTYEYHCEKCGHRFEAVQPISAQSLRVCPENSCARKKWGHGRVKRQISGGTGLLFKGSGFYITDYRSEGYKQAAKKDSTAPAAPAAPASASAESRPAPAKTTAKPEKK